MELTKEEYLFYEWLILGKGFNEDQFKKITNYEFIKLKEEYNQFYKNLR